MNIRKGNILQLIAPTQVKLKAPVEINFQEYMPGKIVTLEKHTALALVRGGKAEPASGPTDPSRSSNAYTVKEAKPVNAVVEEKAQLAEEEEEAPSKGRK